MQAMTSANNAVKILRTEGWTAHAYKNDKRGWYVIGYRGFERREWDSLTKVREDVRAERQQRREMVEAIRAQRAGV